MFTITSSTYSFPPLFLSLSLHYNLFSPRKKIKNQPIWFIICHLKIIFFSEWTKNSSVPFSRKRCMRTCFELMGRVFFSFRAADVQASTTASNQPWYWMGCWGCSMCVCLIALFFPARPGKIIYCFFFFIKKRMRKKNGLFIVITKVM